MSRKIQLPAIGGIRKVIEIPDAGTTIAEIGSGTITLAQLSKLITVQQQNATPPSSNLVGDGTEATLKLGAGLSGGGALLGNVPIRLDPGSLPGANAFALMDDAASAAPDYPVPIAPAPPQTPSGPAPVVLMHDTNEFDETMVLRGLPPQPYNAVTSTGTNVPTLGANKPGSAVSLTPVAWETVIINGITYYRPLWQ